MRKKDKAVGKVIHNRRIRNHNISKNSNSKWKKIIEVFFKNKYYIYVILVIVNILFTIYMASKNNINYVNLIGEDILMSKNTYLYFGRNYINLIIIGFFSLYTVVMRKFLIKKKINLKIILFTILFYFILDVILFCLFTNKVY